MENVNPPPTNNHPVLLAVLRARINQELNELHVISAFVDSRLESIKQFLNNFANQPNETNMNNLEFDDEAVDTAFVSLFSHSDNDSDGFRKFTAYLDPFLPMNIISRKVYNTIMVDGLEGMRRNLVAIVRDVFVFVGSFTYITDFVMLEDIGEFIMSYMAEVLMGRPFRKITKLKYDVAKGLVSFTKIFDTCTYRMPRIIPRLKNFNWSKVPPLLELSQNNLMKGLRHSHEKNKFMYKNCLNLGPEYQVNESMKEWLIRGHVSIHETMLYLMRRSLEVLRKFHWMILEGRFNQFSHVSSLLLSKSGEY
ncbi:hypothetical protein Tco_0368482 [Tanacetum coccineum]